MKQESEVNEMKRKEYESPEMEILDVELEHGFMGASAIEKDEDAEVKNTSQEIEGTYTFDENSAWE